MIGACATSGGGSWPLTPHLTSPLEGGRDELRPGCASLMSGTAGCPRRSAGLADPGKRERGLVGFCACLFWQRTDARPFSRRRRAPRYCHCPPPLLPLCGSGLTAVQHLLRYPQGPPGKQIRSGCKCIRITLAYTRATRKRRQKPPQLLWPTLRAIGLDHPMRTSRLRWTSLMLDCGISRRRCQR